MRPSVAVFTAAAVCVAALLAVGHASSVDALRRTNWPCSFVVPLSNLSLDAILGRWYLLEVISPVTGQRHDACAGVDFWRWDDDENTLLPGGVTLSSDREHLIMRGFNRYGNGSSYRIDTATIVEDSGNAVWDQPSAMGAAVAVLDFSADERFLTVTTCVRALSYEWTCVMGREHNATDLPVELSAIHERLRAAGLKNTEHGNIQDTSGCTYR